MLDPRADFICPACGARNVDPDLKGPATLSPEDKGGGILPHVTCPICERRVPQHLAERWGGLSVDEAAAEWKQLYG